MFYKKLSQPLSKFVCFFVICLFTQAAYAKVVLKYPGCHHFDKLNLTVPLDFIAYLQETQNDDAGLKDAQDHFQSMYHRSNYQNTEWMAVVPDLQDRLMVWRVATKRSVDGAKDECQTQPISLAPIQHAQQFAAAAAVKPTRPQHSIAKSIFRKKEVSIQLFDINGTPDGDIVHVFFNGELIRKNVPLLKYPGTTIPLTLKESALLISKANFLVLFAVSGGSFLNLEFHKATPGISISPANAGQIVSGGPLLDVFPRSVKITDPPPVFVDGITQGGFSVPLFVGLGLVCYDPFDLQQTQSTRHAIDALVGIPDSNPNPFLRRIRQNRIVTIDRVGATARRTRSVAGYPIIPGNDRDEYPPAVFLENAGSAHVRSILLNDNRSFAGYLVSRITGTGGTLNPLFRNGDQIELTVAPRNRFVTGFPAYCKDAW